jgi:methylmalonyl-CoA/ethylmalonyl-CoA epimerase
MTSPGNLALSPRLAALGPIMQLAFVPTDFHSAIDYWTKVIGVGPFFLWEHIAVDELKYWGELVSVDFSVAIAQWGDVQIELIRQDDAGPSIYRDWNSDALHHIQLAVDDYDEALAACERAGFPVAMAGQGLVGSKDLRFAYCDLGRFGPAGFIEFAYRPPGGGGALERMNRMKEAALNWDGSDPVRPLF